MKSREAYVLDMISSILSGGKSSRLYKKMVDDKKMALGVQTINLAQEDYGTYLMLALPVGDFTLQNLLSEIDVEVEKVQQDLISDRDLEKLQNSLETQFVNRNSSVLRFLVFQKKTLLNFPLSVLRLFSVKGVTSHILSCI